MATQDEEKTENEPAGSTQSPSDTPAGNGEEKAAEEKPVKHNWKDIVDPKGYNNQRCSITGAERRLG